MNSFHYCNTEHCVSTGGPRTGNLHIFNLECFSSLHNTVEHSTSWETVRSCRVKKFLSFCGTTIFIAAFTRARHLSLVMNQSPPPPHPTSLRSILHQYPVRTSSRPIRAECPAILSLLDLITRITFGNECRSWSSLLCGLPNHPVLEHRQLTFLPQLNTLRFMPIPNKAKIFGSVYLKLSISL